MAINLTVLTVKPSTIAADLIVFPVWQQEAPGKHLPAALRRTLQQQARRLSFDGSWAQAELFIGSTPAKASLLAVVGMGKQTAAPALQAEAMRRGLAKILQEGRRHLVKTVAVDLSQSPHPAALATAVTEAALFVDYQYTEFSPRLSEQQKKRALHKVSLLVDPAEAPAVRRAVKEAESLMSGVSLARDLVNRPASGTSPKALVERARAIAKQSPYLTVKVMDRKQAAKANFSAFLAVARGSQEEPYVIHLIYKPPQATARVALVGKGVTFDSGGLSIKPADNMETMKIDMAGAATVLGLFAALPDLAPAVEVHGIIAACENMPSGNAYRPGDILMSRNGKTIEVINTDAEGRITLADALDYAIEQKPDAVIDVATLTGACMVALGEAYAGLWSNRPSLRRALLAAARESGEGMVALPLPPEYRPMIESKLADVRNLATTRWGGAITAALFLEQFVSGVAWAHIDVAGPIYSERSILPYWTYGATGYGVRTLATFLKQYE